MNIIKKVVVFVMGLVVIGVVATTIGVVTQSKTVQKNVTFGFVDEYDLTIDVYTKISEYAIIDGAGEVTNVVNIDVNNDNGEAFGLPKIDFDTDTFIIYDAKDDAPYLEIMPYSLHHFEDGLFVSDIITITFEVEQETPAIIKALLFLAPLILSASLIGFLAFKKGDE